jgi:hypothetical protein
VGQRRRILAARRMVQGRRVSRDATILRDAPLPVTRHVRDRAPSRLLPLAERMLRGYWQLARYWI